MEVLGFKTVSSCSSLCVWADLTQTYSNLKNLSMTIPIFLQLSVIFWATDCTVQQPSWHPTALHILMGPQISNICSSSIVQ